MGAQSHTHTQVKFEVHEGPRVSVSDLHRGTLRGWNQGKGMNKGHVTAISTGKAWGGYCEKARNDQQEWLDLQEPGVARVGKDHCPVLSSALRLLQHPPHRSPVQVSTQTPLCFSERKEQAGAPFQRGQEMLHACP